MKVKTGWINLLWGLTLILGLILLPTKYAHAYLDPGTGSFLLQMLVAGFLGILFVLRMFRNQIVFFFKRLLGRQATPAEIDEHMEN